MASSKNNRLRWCRVVFAADVGFAASFIGARWGNFVFEEVGELGDGAGGGLDEVDY